MTNVLNYLNSPELAAILVVVIPILLKVASLFKFDTTKLPKWAQPLPALALAFLGSLLVYMESGKTLGDALLILVLSWAGAGGVYSAAKRWVPKPGEKTPKAVTSASIVFLALLTLPACAGSLEETRLAGLNPQARMAAPPPSARCASLDDQHRWFGGIGKTTAVLAGAEGISTWPIHSERGERALAIGAGVTAAVSIGSLYLSDQALASWQRECE